MSGLYIKGNVHLFLLVCLIRIFGLQIEFEPEYLMGEFNQNPDIDEKPPIPLRDALEKMKPFLMAYEGIQSQEEWEVWYMAFSFLCNLCSI